MAIIAIRIFIAMKCAGISLIAIYAIDIVGCPCAAEGPKLRRIKLPERLRRRSWSDACPRANRLDPQPFDLDLSASKFDVAAARDRVRASKATGPTHVATDRSRG